MSFVLQMILIVVNSYKPLPGTQEPNWNYLEILPNQEASTIHLTPHATPNVKAPNILHISPH